MTTRYQNATILDVIGSMMMEVVVTTNGVGTNFGVGVGKARPRVPTAGDGVLGEGAATS